MVVLSPPGMISPSTDCNSPALRTSTGFGARSSIAFR